jgi:hypothetical protein
MWQLHAYRILDHLIVSVVFYESTGEGHRFHPFGTLTVPVVGEYADGSRDELAYVAECLLDLAHDGAASTL